MSLEPGGRADKYGNRYENRYLAKLLLRLVQEEITSVIVEPLGENSDSVEFVAEQKDGTVLFYQCKASNTTHTSWNISDLRKYDVFQRARNIVEKDAGNSYFFISPLQYGELSELCNRARTNSSADDFVMYQLTNTKIRDWFYDCVAELNLNKNSPSDITEAVSILSHCYFEQYADGQEAERDLESFIGLLFSGKASTVRVLLEQYANDTSSYGIKITSNEVIQYLSQKDIHKRNYSVTPAVLDRINTINDTYWGTFNAVCNTIIHRDATDDVIENIRRGYSVVLHGRAGAGKSGCLEEIIYYLKRNNILFLSIKLDKHIPHISADVFGRELGLPESPIYCLSNLAAGKQCVLILDQLDALRWTCNHSSDALDVCKELIRQAETLNKHFNEKIAILFASRTFDLENDTGLKGLFENTDNSHSQNWKKVRIENFTTDNVIQLIGHKYNNFSSRLKKLLLVPSSLYVWSKLEENSQKNSISSVFELMNTWWKQIQQNCSAVNVQTQGIIDCKSKIVNSMESRDAFSAPKAIFIDQTNEINFLVSTGLLTCNAQTNSISFSHQSFLDYFITSDLLAKVYSGHELNDLIGSSDEQTPLNRYRLLSVLQNLLESDPTLFAKQSVSLLQSSSVRFYFKCAVFEVISQCDYPTTEIYKIIDEYYQKPEWSDYITQVVFYSHPQFVMRLHASSDCGFPSDQSLSLLKSISNLQPDFVVEELEPFTFQNTEQDSKIFFSLCHDANYDSDRMFSLRKKLLQDNPNLFSSFWGFPELIKRGSLRAIELFEIIIESWPNKTTSHVHFSDAKDMNHYIKQNAIQIATELFPRICDATSEFLPQWPHYRWNHDFEDWLPNHYQKSAVRSITEIVKDSFAEWAQSAPDKLLSYVKNIAYPISAIGHECIMHALLYLPPSYADEVLSWFLEDINQKIFVYSSNEKDFTLYSAKIIKKFSSQCNNILFQKLESYICNWKEPIEQMLSTYKSRLEVRNECHASVYYAYWGHFQKAFLPSLDNSRLSICAKQLLNVVNRNPWIHLPYFYCGFSVGEAKAVVSPVENKTERLSDKTWLQIISTPSEKMNEKWGHCETDTFYVEASHETFASALGKQAKSEPMRFASLALSFPDRCYDGYVSHVLYALDDDSSGNEFDTELVSRVIRRFGKSNNPNIAIATSRVIEAHANEVWPDDILKLVEWIALFHPNPAKDEYCISTNSDPEHLSSRSLLDNSINCARGCAFRAIGALLWSHRELGNHFKNAISFGLNDPNPAVKFAVMYCVLPYYNIDRTFAVEAFFSLLKSDLRILFAPGSWELMSREYDEHGSFFRETLVEACKSEIDDLAEHAAGLICAVAIYSEDQEALDFILTYQMSDKQQEKICFQAVSSFNLDEHHERSKIILMHLIDHSQNELSGFNRLFFDRCIDIQRDEVFLIHLMESVQGVHLLHSFMDYLCESDENICSYACVLNAISNGLPQMSPNIGIRIVINDLVKCVIRLFDSGKDDPNIREICLNAWDKLFMSNLQDIKPLADMIDDFE